MRYASAQHRTLGLIALALLALIVGGAVYLLDRPAGSAQLVPAIFELGCEGRTVFAGAGSWLPSLVHIYAFILLTAAVIRPSQRSLLLICLAWVSIEACFELIQHPLLIELLTGRMGDRLVRVPGSEMLRDYAASGVFDPLDLGALGIGAVAAYLTVRLAWKREGLS